MRPVALSFFRGVLCPGAGVAGGNSLSFASPKESKQRKGDPGSCVPCASLRGNLRYSVQPGSKTTRLRLKQVFALIRLALRSSAHPQGGGNRNTEQPTAECRNPNTRRNKDTPWRVLVGICLRSPFPIAPSVCAEERRVRRIRDRDCLSRRRVRARPRLDRAPQVARSEAEGRRQQGRLFFCLLFFWRSKRKVSSRRATPGQLPSAKIPAVRTKVTFVTASVGATP